MPGKKQLDNVQLIFMISFFLLFMAAGCAGNKVRIKGECIVPAKDRIQKGSVFYVVENNTMEKTGVLKGIRNSVARHLVSNGYKSGTMNDADFFLAIGYGIGADRKIREPVLMATLNAPYSAITVPSVAASTPTVQPVGSGPISMMHTHTVYEVWMVIKLIDGKIYRETKKLSEIWTCAASMVEYYPPPYEKTVDSMIPVILSRLCENVEMSIIVK